jgi:hypothetical protein
MELLFGLSLLANRALPVMLAAALPVAFITFMLDALILDDFVRWFAGEETGAALWAAIADMVVGGLCVLLPHLWLMLCYRDYYRPAFVWRAEPRLADAEPRRPAAEAAPASAASPALGRAMLAFGWVALLFQAYNLYLFVGMIRFG